MNNEKKKNYKNRIVWIIIILLSPVIFRTISGILKPDIDDICARIEEHLYEKYGEEFVVDRIGIRTANGKEFYQARIYSKSIIGTNKQGDSYYYSTASLYKKSFGRLGGVGDGYGKVMMNISAEEYLMSKTKEIFGERVLIKTDIKYKKREESGYFVQFLEENFKEQLVKINNDPNNHRIEMDLYIYIFDRIETEEEKEERRKQIFDFIQYLKEEGLFEHLEMGVIFIDERVLAPGYIDYYYKINRSEKVKEEIEGETVYLPPLELRKEMSEVLQKEVDRMSEEEMLESMREIKKSDLSYEGIREYNTHYMSWVISIGMMKVNRQSFFDKVKKNQQLEKYYYNTLEDISLSTFSDYIYVD